MVHKAFLLLGSNINPEKNLPLAVSHLKQKVKILRFSRVWQTPAVGSWGPDFLNAAIEIKTGLSKEELKKEVLHKIELNLGRVRTENKNEPRTIDLDIILFDDEILDQNLWVKSFIALPMADIHPSLINPLNNKKLSQTCLELKNSVLDYPHILILE